MQEGNDGPEPKRKRGPYKRWLLDPSVPIPPSTVHSRELAAARASSLEQSGNSQSAEFQISDHDNESESVVDEVISLHEDDAQTEVHEPDQTVVSDHPTDKQAKDKQTSKQEDFIKKHHLDKLIQHQSKLSKLDVLVAILHMAVRHCHTQHFIEDQIKFVNFLLGDNVLDVSYYIFKTLFTPSVTITKHFFCLDCEFYLGKDEDFMKLLCPECKTLSDDSSSGFVVCPDCSLCVGSVEDFVNNQYVQCPKCVKNIDINSKVPESAAVCCNCKFYMSSKKKFFKKVEKCQCPKCRKQIDVNSVTSGNFFVTFPLREQLEEFLSKPGLKFVSRTERDPNVIADICDGEFYRKLMEPGGPLENPNAITVTFNTDGVEVFESTRNDMYPIWYHINELIPEQRFKQDNLLLAGIWFSNSAPNMALFMEPFAEQLINLAADGVSRTLPNGACVKCPVYPFMCTVDSVCKAKITCQKQFNGKFGCLYCYHPNDTTSETLKTKQTFYCQENVYKLRTDEEVIRDMVKADSLQRQGLLKPNESVNGFMGISILLKFTALLQFLSCNPFGIVWGIAIDYMHAALEGVTSDLFNIIGNILTPDQLKILDMRIQKITPPQAMTRRPRGFSDRVHWKAKEYRAVLLYYILPCLDGLLADKYYNNLKLFVNALHILLSDSITTAKLLEATTCLDKFCVGYQRLYGIVNVSYNLHICRHFPEMVKRYGALWGYSNFVFESGNGYLLKFIRGTKSVVNEIAMKYTTIKTASKLMVGNISDYAVNFYSEILKSKYPKNNEEIVRAPMVSSHSVGQVSESEAQMLIEKNVSVSESNTVKYFNRVIRDEILYCSRSYTKSNVHDDSCVKLYDGRFAVIDKFVKSSSEELLCIVKPIRISQGMDIIPAIKRCSHDVFERSQIILFSSVQRKCVMATVDDSCFVCKIPNERD